MKIVRSFSQSHLDDLAPPAAPKKETAVKGKNLQPLSIFPTS
jgi:hypothetical protein